MNTPCAFFAHPYNDAVCTVTEQLGNSIYTKEKHPTVAEC